MRMLDSTPERIVETFTASDASPKLQRRRRKRHRAYPQERFERIQMKVLISFLSVLTIALTLGIWYELLKN